MGPWLNATDDKTVHAPIGMVFASFNGAVAECHG